MNELQGKRILIVEDDATNMAVFSVTLRDSGAKVIQDMWNTGAVDHMLGHVPLDLIILDLMLRRQISGYDIYHALRQHQELATVPVVIVSAADPAVEIPRARALGLSGFIGKPIRPYLFPRQIAALIAGESIWYAQDGRQELIHE